MKAIETHECTRTVPFTRGIQPLVGFDVSNLVSEEKRVRFNRVRLMPSFQAFSLAQPACPRNSLSYAIERCIFYYACVYMFDNNEHVCHSLLVISLQLIIRCSLSISVYIFIRDNLDIYYFEFLNNVVVLLILKYLTNMEQKRRKEWLFDLD